MSTFTGFSLSVLTLDASIAAKKGTMLALTNNAQNNDQAEEEREEKGDSELTPKELPDIEENNENLVDPEQEPDYPTDLNVADPNIDSNKMTLL